MQLSSLPANAATGQATAERAAVDTRARIQAVSPATETSQAEQKAEQKADVAAVQAAVRTLNEFTQAHSQAVRFSIDDESGKVVVRVVDSQTNELLRQIPSEDVLSIAQSLSKMSGLLVRDKA